MPKQVSVPQGAASVRAASVAIVNEGLLSQHTNRIRLNNLDELQLLFQLKDKRAKLSVSPLDAVKKTLMNLLLIQKVLLVIVPR